MNLPVKNRLRIGMTFLLFWIGITTARAALILPSLFSNGMVLQREVPVRIWGTESPGQKITLLFRGIEENTTAGADGSWTVSIPAGSAGGPFELKISASSDTVIRDILVGEVWLCSGQSNMVLPMERVKEKYPQEIREAGQDKIRQFFVPVRYDFKEEHRDVSGKWESADSVSVLRFSAVAYFFARELYERYGIPVGLINVSAGGTPVAAWLDDATLKDFPEDYEELKKFQDNDFLKALRSREGQLNRQWYELLAAGDEGRKSVSVWSEPGYSAEGWKSMSIPAMMDAKDGPGQMNGSVWFRKTFEWPAHLAGKPAKLFLGRLVDSDSVYVNGVFSGTISYQYPPRRYQVPEGVLKPGKNVVLVRLISQSGTGGFVPEKRYELEYGTHKTDLSGIWQYKTGVKMPPLEPSTFYQAKPEGVFNGMLAPLIPYTIRGVIWYQGESDVDRPEKYEEKLKRMISLWRARWGQGDFPFLYVQLANFLEPSTAPAESKWAEIREAQRQVQNVKHTAMAVAMDLGEWNDLHPLNKKEVGHRLVLLARNKVYGETKGVFSGPVLKGFQLNKGKVILEFSDTGKGLKMLNGKQLRHFDLAGEDDTFFRAKAKIRKGRAEVWHERVPQPVILRYAWADNPSDANLYNIEGLPAAPFRIIVKEK